MPRAQRLLALLQLLRSHRFPVTAQRLAQALGTSVRTLYRDIGILRAQGAPIEGEAGLGYVLRPGFMLPPLMFGEDEIEALVLGVRWVAQRGDARLSEAARQALCRIGAVLPADLRRTLDDTALLVGPAAGGAGTLPQDLSPLRLAIRSGHKLALDYQAPGAAPTRRIVWPFALGFFEQVRVLVGWCELRQDFRHFRTDRISALQVLDERYPRSRQSLLKAWRAREGIAAQDVTADRI